jgi:hypothetical protein
MRVTARPDPKASLSRSNHRQRVRNLSETAPHGEI